MRWCNVAVMPVLMLAAVLAPAAMAKDKPAPVRKCGVEAYVTIGSISLTRLFGPSSNVDSAVLGLPGVPLGQSFDVQFTYNATYTGPDALDPGRSNVTISARVQEKGDYWLRLYGAGAPIDVPQALPAKRGATIEITMAADTFDTRFAKSDALDVAVVRRFKDGSKYEAPASRIDLRMLHKRQATVHNLRAMLDALPPGPETACLTDDPAQQVTFHYSCARRWSDELGQFSVYPTSLEWKGTAGPEVNASLSTNSYGGERPGAGKLFILSLIAPVDKLTQRRVLWIDGQPAAGSGGRADLSGAMAGTAKLTAVFSAPGKPDERFDLSPTIFRDAIGRLSAAYDAMLDDENVLIGRCKVEREVFDPNQPPDIVI